MNYQTTHKIKHTVGPYSPEAMAEILMKGFQERYVPSEDLLDKLPWFAAELKRIADRSNGAFILEDLIILKDDNAGEKIEHHRYCLYRRETWMSREDQRARLSKEVHELHHKNQTVEVRRKLVAAALRRKMNMPPSNNQATILAYDIVANERKELLIALNIDPQETLYYQPKDCKDYL